MQVFKETREDLEDGSRKRSWKMEVDYYSRARGFRNYRQESFRISVLQKERLNSDVYQCHQIFRTVQAEVTHTPSL